MLHSETTTTKRPSSDSRTKVKNVITILVDENPKRPKTRGYKQFAILMRYNGKSIDDFKAEEGRHSTLDEQPGWPAAELRWCITREFIKIS